ncbi:MAG: restriction endonuclease subunit S [Flavobacteriaceae bacterium]|nr:restriction endonuclease subunit S [Flavobacteriaceae bacterium]
MSGWQNFKLGEIIEDVAMGPFGSNLKRDNFITSGVPVIRGGNLNEGGFDDELFVFVSEEKAQSLKRSLAYPDDLVFTHRGTIGQVGLIKKGKYPYYLVSQSQVRLTVNKKFLDPKFLFYWFKSPIGQYELLKNSAQVGVPSIASPTKSLKEIDISIPPLSTQKAIAEILSSLDDKIELNNQINQNLEALAQALFKQWFVDFEFPNENGEPYKSSGGEMVNSELGEIPKGWEVRTLEDISKLIRGISYRKHELVEKEEGLPFINLKCFALDGTFRQDGLKYFNGKYKDHQIIQPNDILIAVTDLTQDRIVIGLPIIWSRREAALPSLDVCIVRPKKNGLNNFLYYEFKTHRYKSRIIEFANGSTVLHLSVKGLETYKFGVPPINLLNSWNDCISPILERIEQNISENRELTNLRDTLLPKLISGKLEVNQIEKEVYG